MSEKKGLLAGGVAVLVALAVAIVCFLGAHHAQSQADDQSAALQAAKTRVPALLSYRTESLDADLAVAKQQTTGRFSSDYAKILDNVVEPTAKKGGISTDAEVSAAGVVSHSGDKVVVLAFLTQTTTNKSQRQSVSGSRVEVTMQHTGDTWKVAGLKTL